MEESGARTKSLTVGKPGFGELVKVAGKECYACALT